MYNGRCSIVVELEDEIRLDLSGDLDYLKNKHEETDIVQSKMEVCSVFY